MERHSHLAAERLNLAPAPLLWFVCQQSVDRAQAMTVATLPRFLSWRGG